MGGAPAAGKTTVADRLARRHGLRSYRSDTRTWVHRDRALAAGNPAARRFEDLSPAARWARPTDELLAMSLHDVRGPMVVDDLRALPVAPLVLAEGSTLPAGSVTGAAAQGRALWLIPSPAFQAGVLESRRTNEGTRRLYARLRDVIEQEARDHDIPVLTVDGSGRPDDLVAEVQARFGATLRAGPCATERGDRATLLREANLAVVAQHRGYFGRSWATGDADAVTRAFACECGTVACTAEVRTTIGRVAAGAVRAPGHP